MAIDLSPIPFFLKSKPLFKSKNTASPWQNVHFRVKNAGQVDADALRTHEEESTISFMGHNDNIYSYSLTEAQQGGRTGKIKLAVEPNERNKEAVMMEIVIDNLRNPKQSNVEQMDTEVDFVALDSEALLEGEDVENPKREEAKKKATEKEDELRKSVIEKLSFLIKILNEAQNEASAASFYNRKMQWKMFLASLSETEKDYIRECQGLEKLVYKPSEWTNTYMNLVYFSFTAAAFFVTAFGIPGAGLIPVKCDTGDSAAAAVFAAAYWNLGSDCLGVGIQTSYQFAREEKILGTLNTIGLLAAVICTGVGVAAYFKGNIEAALALCGWSFALGMFTSAAVELKSCRSCLKNKANYVEQLKKNSNENFIDAQDQEALLAWQSFGGAIGSTAKLVQKSAEILEKSMPKKPRPTAEQLNSASDQCALDLEKEWQSYEECRMRLNVIIREHARATNHYRTMWSWIGCGIAMVAASITVTAVTMDPTCTSIGISVNAFTHLSSCLGLSSGIFRLANAHLANDIVNAEEAIKQRDEYLNCKEQKYKIVKNADELMPGDMLLFVNKKNEVSYRLKKFNGDEISGTLKKMPQHDSYLSKLLPENDGLSEDDTPAVLDFLETQQHIVTKKESIVGVKSIFRDTFVGIGKRAVSAVSMFSHAHESDKGTAAEEQTLLARQKR